RARRGARLAAITSGGAIPETAQYRVVLETDGTFVGTVDEDFAVESLAGDVFLLGNSSWMIRHVRGDQVTVVDAHGAPPTIPFWLGEAPGRTIELSDELSTLRKDIAAQISDEYLAAQAQNVECPTRNEEQSDTWDRVYERRASSIPNSALRAPHSSSEPFSWLQSETGCCPYAAEQAVRYIAAQKAAVGLVPTGNDVVFERFFDESGGMQLVIHAPLGARMNKAWG